MSANDPETLWVAVVGAGPAGFYTAEALIKDNEAVRVDLIDRLPTPYGLIRGGVAPDHQSIKGVYRRYEKTALSDRVRFLGNLELGRDVSVDELLELYDAVVLATGAPEDRKLGIPGEDKPGVISSAAFVGWYNSHPDFADLNPDLNVATVAVIGNGNVAVDVARVLAKTAGEMAESDLAPYAADVIHAAPIRDIWMFGRRGPIEGAFTQKELGELGQLENCVALTDAADLPDDVGDIPEKEQPGKRKNLGHLKSFAENKESDHPVRLRLKFYARPVEILGGERVEGLRLEHTRVENGKCIGTGRTFEIACGAVIPCIGYRTLPVDHVPFDEWGGKFVNEDGLISPRLYAVGWAERGPTGTIGTNRPDGIAVAKRILSEVKPGGRPGGNGFDELVAARKLRVVSFDGWKKIESAETAAAVDRQPRLKYWKIEEMLKVLD